jgi:hypothetical protein
VNVAYTSSDNCGGESCELSVTSNEPDNGLGDGDKPNDFTVVNSHLVQLRAERSGTGNGRTYTITITCTDAAGNPSTKTVTVKVPKSDPGNSLPGGPTTVAELPKELSFAARQADRGAGNVRFDFGLPERASVQIEVFDVGGRRVGSVNPGTLDAGWHDASWRFSSNEVSSGVYFARFLANGIALSKRIVIVR